jgi:hypothetical protein
VQALELDVGGREARGGKVADELRQEEWVAAAQLVAGAHEARLRHAAQALGDEVARGALAQRPRV